MSDNDAGGLIVSGMLAVFAAAMLLRGVVVWGDWDDLVRAAAGAVVLAVAVLAAVASAGLRSRRRMAGAMVARVDTHGATGPATAVQRLIGRHEVGHVVGAEATGMGVASVTIGDGHGYVQARRWTTVDDAITFLACGHLAVHTKRGAGSDLAQIRDLAREIPADQRRERLHAAIGRARDITAREQGRIRRDGHRLADTGRWSR